MCGGEAGVRASAGKEEGETGRYGPPRGRGPPRTRRHVVHLLHAAQREQLRERVHGAAVLQVAHQRHRGARHAAQLAVDRAKVEQRLRGMLAHAVARVEEGHGARRGGLRGGALCGVAQHHHLAVARERAHAVAQRLPLCRGGGGLRHLQHRAAQALHGRRKGARGARGGLVKHVGQHAVRKERAAAAGAHNPRHRARHAAQKVHHVGVLQLRYGDDVVAGKVRGGGNRARVG